LREYEREIECLQALSHYPFSEVRKRTTERDCERDHERDRETERERERDREREREREREKRKMTDVLVVAAKRAAIAIGQHQQPCHRKKHLRP
jgi:hypothetical protein